MLRSIGGHLMTVVQGVETGLSLQYCKNGRDEYRVPSC